MRKVIAAVVLLFVVVVWTLLAQTTFTLSAPPPSGVTVVSATVVGPAGNTTYWYWVVAKYAIGNSLPVQAPVVNRGPDTFTAQNNVVISWLPAPNAIGYDVLRTTTANLPSVGNIAVATGLGAGTNTFQDTNNAPSSYTVNNAPGATAQIILDNTNYPAPVMITSTAHVWGPSLTNFNAFDRNTANGVNLFLLLNDPVKWSPVIGLNESNNTGTNFVVGGYFQSSCTNNSGTIQNCEGLFGEADAFNLGTRAAQFGLYGLTENHAGTSTLQGGLTTWVQVDAGASTTNAYGWFDQPHVINGTITGNHYGAYINDITGALGQNIAIRTGLGWNSFGDFVAIGGTITTRPSNFLTIKGSGAGVLSAGQLSDASTFGCIVFNATGCAIANYNIASDGTDLRLNSPSNTIINAIGNVAKMTVAGTGVSTSVPLTVNSGANTLLRCTVAGALPIGALTIAAGNCGASVDTGLRVN